ncbi:uncharacterized protein LOC129731566 [Wyeomyia smithii]|uniref:uncharacterized protein LOC129731566 n=1 Tax=Wyeomyia smithii TaxID=174621 RepID=UPI002467B818|nr:uncharacterized protein LOC129731566 [Wyeomyia smithii]XP_055547640.1 uncharacterized protein LOC129731566 [Wyeomyia smithii]XP_055547641.1 uncharacterized protein LOC129731566 [Wyeomyia smithii]XP_055547642.1 uncharacterized protein LOC129731566 [Wyeomyia smithii]XP_055547643.1 uncharacterized protein LOC129731566 [Wyeomyia smithii]XP_055547644.1 uncharacterized protein LOC129731566 [Wyeomyia smithii]XP_055547645.1 uncharacterized protein LOC129731566 [Wyeomyia smithii]XP_055547646.1 unc
MLLQPGPTLSADQIQQQQPQPQSSPQLPNPQTATAQPSLQQLPVNLLSSQQPSSLTSSSSASSTPPIQDVSRYLDMAQETLKEGWTVHTAKDGRLYYCNHITRTAGWLPPIENWIQTIDLPYGWEKAVDLKGQPYYINHLNKTTTYEEPERYHYNDSPPEPRLVVLHRSPTLGFGFVAGSEKPVIVRFVTEGGPSVNKLEPGDQILAVNGEDVKDAPRDHVIQLVRNCENTVTLLVCQPQLYNAVGRKSTLLSAGKKAKLKSRPIRVRFAESVCVNGAPLFPPSAFSLGDLCVPPMANVLKVFLENGQTKSFKYDSTTSVQDVVTSLRDKLCLTAKEHFSLVLEHVKSLKRNKLTLLDPQETVARIAARPGAHKLRCLFRVTFVPVSAAALAQRDLNALDYLFLQCCNDVTQERFAPELQPEVALRLAALHMHQHALANNISPAKLTVKTVEREFGLDRFVPASLIDGMKRKELRRLLGHFLKLNSQMTGSSTKMLTQLQAKIHYLDIISGLPSYGAKCFSTNQRDGVERVLLVSPRFGLSQIAGVRNTVPQPICILEDLTRVVVTRDDDVSNTVTVFISPDRVITFSMEDRDACEFAIVLAGYYRLMAGKELPLEQERETAVEEIAPPYLSQHTVLHAPWSYLPSEKQTHSMAFLMPPPYHSSKTVQIPSKSDDCDRNVNNTLTSNKNLKLAGSDEYGFDMFNPRFSRDGLERGIGGSLKLHTSEARNEEVLRRVAEMHKMVESSESYLNEHGEYCHEFDVRPGKLNLWRETSVDVESDCESLNSSKQSSNEDAPGILKHSDSLTLLTETINQGLDGIAKGLNSIYTAPFSEVNGQLDNNSAQSTPKSQRKVQGLSQILSDLQALGNDLSQSESDSESLYTPNSSPIHKNPNQLPQSSLRNKTLRTSFGLHSPDSSILGCETKDMNLKEYLRQLKEASNSDNVENTDLAAKKIAELYGYEIGDESIIETDPDIIDLRSIPPPQTPDELDNLNVLNVPPTGFDDVTNSALTASNETTTTVDNVVGDLEEFLKKVTIEPPTKKITPAVELTPEEILSYIIPPPPGLGDIDPGTKQPTSLAQKNNLPSIQNPVNSNSTNTKNHNQTSAFELPVPKPRISTETNSINLLAKYDKSRFEVYYPPELREQKSTEYDLYSNSAAANANESEKVNGHVIEYPTVDRKGPFSCCSKSKKEKTDEPTGGPVSNGIKIFEAKAEELALPPKRCPHNSESNPPERPPKSADLQLKLHSPLRSPNYAKTNGNTRSYYEMDPPSLPPRFEKQSTSPPPVNLSTLPPKKPPLPPVPLKPCIRSPVPILKNPVTYTLTSSANNSPIRTAGIGSPHLHRNPNCYREIERAFNRDDLSDKPPQSLSPTPMNRQNGHYRSHSDCPPVCLKTPPAENRPQLSLLCSPQMSRKTTVSNPSSPILSNKNGHVLNVDTLMAKTDVAMAGLLVKLDQVAAMCSAAQTAGGGTSIDEDKFQQAKDELTDQSLHLVTASKHLVVSMSDANLTNLPEHLTACLTSLRRITELAQDLTRYTSAPLQTRNIVLKIHDVASSFRELACVRVGPLGAGQLALHAECLANVLATLLRSLRVFSP